MFAANPMRQVPALILPGGALMTESSAILTWLADAHPERGWRRTMASHARPAFLRWMAFVSNAIYAMYWIRDDPSRIIDDAEIGKAAKARIGDRFVACWAIMESQVDPRPLYPGRRPHRARPLRRRDLPLGRRPRPLQRRRPAPGRSRPPRRRRAPAAGVLGRALSVFLILPLRVRITARAAPG
ncbi:MAG: glutathione S-transferase family protein [Caulobacteraceae bacterium]